MSLISIVRRPSLPGEESAKYWSWRYSINLLEGVSGKGKSKVGPGSVKRLKLRKAAS